MFDVSMTEVLVVVTGAGLLLGRKEITYGSKVIGWSVGKLVGSLQGVRMKYEEKTRGTHLHQLHKHVKDGLQDMGSIGTDLNALSGRGGTIGNYARQAQQQQQRAAAAADNKPFKTAGAGAASAGVQSDIGGRRRTGGILGSNAAARPAPGVSSVISTHAETAAAAASSSSKAKRNFRLAQLILADDVLNKEKGPASRMEHIRVLGLRTDDGSSSKDTARCSSVAAATATAGGNNLDLTGSDLVESSICESIVQESFAAHAAGHVPAPLTAD